MEKLVHLFKYYAFKDWIVYISNENYLILLIGRSIIASTGFVL